MIVQPGEQGIASEQVEAVFGPNLRRGSLHLTSLRLVFEGLFWEPPLGWVPRTLLDLPLAQVTNAVAIPGKRDRHTLRVEAGRGYVYTFVTPRAPDWVGAIVSAKQRAPRAAATTATHPSAPVVVNVQQSPSQPSVFLHCRHCGSLAPAGSIHCTSCGATL